MQADSSNGLAVNNVAKLLLKRYARAVCVFVGGSFRTNKAASDVDAIVVCERVSAPFADTWEYEGQVMDVFVHSSASLLQTFDRQRRLGMSSAAHHILNSVLVPSDSFEGANLSRVARGIWDRGPEPLDGRRVTVMLCSLRRDLLSDRPPSERVAIGVRSYTAFCNYYLQGHGLWGAGPGSEKTFDRILRAEFPEVHRKLMFAVSELMGSDKVTAMVEMLTEWIDLMGANPIYPYSYVMKAYRPTPETPGSSESNHRND